jgi:hypothetical protein
LAQQIAREPTETTLLSSSTTAFHAPLREVDRHGQANGPCADDGDGRVRGAAVKLGRPDERLFGIGVGGHGVLPLSTR